MLSKALQIMKSNFNNLAVIFSVSFLTSLFSIFWFSCDPRAHVSRRIKETLARKRVKGARAFGCIFTRKLCSYALFNMNTILKNTPEKVHISYKMF